MITKALVLAAGMGSRLREVSGDLPKPLTPFAGGPILTHNLRWLSQSGVCEVFINLHYRGELIRQAIGEGTAQGLRVRYVHEPELLGTAGAHSTTVSQPMTMSPVVNPASVRRATSWACLFGAHLRRFNCTST